MIESGYDLVEEGKAKIAVPKHPDKAVSSEMPVFYNPVMKSNRDITIVLMAAAAKLYGIKKWRIADIMAATGVRGIRMLVELGKGNIEMLKMNDYSAAAVALIKKNLKLNNTKIGKKASVENKEANKFLLGSGMLSYIDIDPFGYPGTFLDAAVKRTRHNGILAVTATDTSALAGSAVNACRRKYLALPLKNSFMHETGLRIMIRLVQMIGAMHEKAMQPVFSYYKEHYIRAFFLCREGAGKVDELLKQHKELLYCKSCCNKKVMLDDNNGSCSNCGKEMAKAGPLWAGKLFDKKLAAGIAVAAAKNRHIGEKTKSFLKAAAEEARHEGKCGPGFYAIEDVCSRHKIGRQPKTADVIKWLRQKGYAATATHCTTTGVKSEAPIKAVVAAIKYRKQKTL